MNSKVFIILRILLGIFVLVFGVNKFAGFLPMPELSEDAAAYFGALTSTKTMILVGIVEIVAGLAIILDKYGALLALILMSISVNAVLFHAVLDPGGISGAAVLLILNTAVVYGYKAKYKALLS
jgi:putative oxidoreductase